MSAVQCPQPGKPSTYQRIPNDRAYRLADPLTVLVPINDPIRNRVLFAKVESKSFDGLPEAVRHASWFIVRDGTARPESDRFTVRVVARGTRQQIAVARLVVGAKAGQYVRLLSADRLDLRLSNLRLRTGPSDRRAKQDALDIASPVKPRVTTTVNSPALAGERSIAA